MTIVKTAIQEASSQTLKSVQSTSGFWSFASMFTCYCLQKENSIVFQNINFHEQQEME